MLDLGCGNQPYAEFARQEGNQYVGIDLSKDHMPAPNVCGDSLLLPFRDESFETVLSTQVIEHVVNPFQMMSEVSRVLKPGGYLILTAPQAWPLHEEPHDYFRYTRYGLELLANRYHLNAIYIRERSGGLLALAQLTDVILYDRFGKHKLTRLPLKLLFSSMLSLCKFLDQRLYYPKFTLGYVMVARKME
ncbi:MAG: class I SAM-dependent methyltransferase [Ignavibacteriales bacterium]|nr:class I SAM-dependent methyltransferase [Ignavibacteriales bacterium]